MNRAFQFFVVPFAIVLVTANAMVPEFASTSAIGATLARVHEFDRNRVAAELDLGRAIRAGEWPSILFEAPPSSTGWSGPYAHRTLLTDTWGNPLSLQPELGIYSFGADAIDNLGLKDDIASWRSPDRTEYPRPSFLLRQWQLLLIPEVLALALIGFPVWLLFGRRKPESALS